MTLINSQSRKELEARVIAKASADPGFRQELLSGSRSAVEKELGLRLPASINVRVVEESDDNVYLVLPARSLAAAQGELSDLELEAVAGGKSSNEPKPKNPLRPSEPLV